jgi:hypothetical protein
MEHSDLQRYEEICVWRFAFLAFLGFRSTFYKTANRKGQGLRAFTTFLDGLCFTTGSLDDFFLLFLLIVGRMRFSFSCTKLEGRDGKGHRGRVVAKLMMVVPLA